TIYASTEVIRFRFVVFQCSAVHLDLHSFPTRRSSDLIPATKTKCFSVTTRFFPDWARLRCGPIGTEKPKAWAPCAVFFRRCSITDRKSTRLNSSHVEISYGVFCLKKINIS